MLRHNLLVYEAFFQIPRKLGYGKISVLVKNVIVQLKMKPYFSARWVEVCTKIFRFEREERLDHLSFRSADLKRHQCFQSGNTALFKIAEGNTILTKGKLEPAAFFAVIVVNH